VIRRPLPDVSVASLCALVSLRDVAPGSGPVYQRAAGTGVGPSPGYPRRGPPVIRSGLGLSSRGLVAPQLLLVLLSGGLVYTSVPASESEVSGGAVQLGAGAATAAGKAGLG